MLRKPLARKRHTGKCISPYANTLKTNNNKVNEKQIKTYRYRETEQESTRGEVGGGGGQTGEEAQF